MRYLRLLLLLCLVLLTLPAQAEKVGLDIYFIDTEGGAATLIVTRFGESVLIDCGNPGDRDADRIYQVAHNVAHLKEIDHLIITHWHSDHYGGVASLASKMPIRHFYDRGIPASLADDPNGFASLIDAYKTASQGKSVTFHPGDTLPFAHPDKDPGLELFCLCANKATIPDKEKAPKNFYARENQPQPEDTSDNANSLGFLLSYGYFRFLDLGDLTWNYEFNLVSPTNKIGMVDVYQSTHHGLDLSNNPVLLKSVRPIVAVVNNGPHKGGGPKLIQNLLDIGPLLAIYMQHSNLDSPPIKATPGKMIVVANTTEPDKGEFIHVQVAEDSRSYTVVVGEKGKPMGYTTRLVPAPPVKEIVPKEIGPDSLTPDTKPPKKGPK